MLGLKAAGVFFVASFAIGAVLLSFDIDPEWAAFWTFWGAVAVSFYYYKDSGGDV